MAKTAKIGKTAKTATKRKIQGSVRYKALASEPTRTAVPKFQSSKTPELISSTTAKNKFANVLEKAIRGQCIVITKHQEPKAVLMSVEQYEAFAPAKRVNTLTDEFNAMLERMQRPGVRKAMDEAFHASPEELGKAAVEAARKRP